MTDDADKPMVAFNEIDAAVEALVKVAHDSQDIERFKREAKKIIEGAFNFGVTLASGPIVEGEGVKALPKGVLEQFRAQLLICMVQRAQTQQRGPNAGHPVRIPVAEVDGTGRFILNMEVDQGRKQFLLEVKRK